MAPAIRKLVTTNGVIVPLIITNLAIGDITPQIALAPNIEACPFKSIFIGLYQ